ncbi:MAG: IS3 family transposase [Cytophagales bacterium]|nr:IS3 family transposase [Cytophagales bacterium]
MKQRRAMVKKGFGLSLNKQLELLNISKGSWYYEAKGESTENLKAMRLMDGHHLEEPQKGVRQMQDFLRDCGMKISEKRVRRLMRKMDIHALYPKRNLSKLGKADYIMPYLLRGLEIERPNQVWETDITYIPMAKGFMYLTAIIDVYSRYVVGWSLSNTLDAAGVHRVMEKAVRDYGAPEILNSDQGSQFTCREWKEKLKDRNIKISMDGRGRATDNAHIERLWRTVKWEHVYLWPSKDGWELEQGLERFFRKYNYQRSHQNIGRKKPAEMYVSMLAKRAA